MTHNATTNENLRPFSNKRPAALADSGRGVPAISAPHSKIGNSTNVPAVLCVVWVALASTGCIPEKTPAPENEGDGQTSPLDVDARPSRNDALTTEVGFSWGTCGDKMCGAEQGENFLSCPLDCLPPPCGNGDCEPGENPVNCKNDCENACGNNWCEPGESPEACPNDCESVCGDGLCEFGEGPEQCSNDCQYPCGNDACESGETPDTCPEDCAVACGDDRCEAPESPLSCPWDCN